MARLTVLPSTLVCGLGAVTVRCSLPVITQRPAALDHRLCIAKLPVASLRSPLGSWPPQAEPPHAHLSAISPPLIPSLLSYQADSCGSVAVSALSWPPTTLNPS